MTVVALATVTTSAAAATASTSATTKPTICVALVVDGRSIGSDVTTTCAKVPKGATGVDVLEAAGHHIGFRDDGLLCTIDGLPKGGCATVDDSHYWAYFHRAPGATTWTYSSEGAATYQPANRSTEGWVYDDGKALTPDNVPYAQICKPTPAPTPTPTRTTSPATSTPSTTPTSHPASTPAARHHSKRPRPPASATAATGVVLTTSPSPSPTSVVLAGAVAPPANHHGWLDLLIGLVVVAALGISATVRFRRARP
jgi:hypothetical protein